MYWVCIRGILKAAPLTIAQGATSHPFLVSAYEQVIANNPDDGYQASGNLFWLDLETQADCPDAAIPFSLKQVKLMESHYFSKPAPIKREVVIRVKEGFDIMANRGFTIARTRI